MLLKIIVLYVMDFQKHVIIFKLIIVIKSVICENNTTVDVDFNDTEVTTEPITTLGTRITTLLYDVSSPSSSVITSTGNENTPLKWWEIFLIVLGSVILVHIIAAILGVILYKKRYKCTRGDSELSQEFNDDDMSQFSVDIDGATPGPLGYNSTLQKTRIIDLDQISECTMSRLSSAADLTEDTTGGGTPSGSLRAPKHVPGSHQRAANMKKSRSTSALHKALAKTASTPSLSPHDDICHQQLTTVTERDSLEKAESETVIYPAEESVDSEGGISNPVFYIETTLCDEI